MYAAIKHLHVACASLSIAGFVFRGILMLRGSPALQWRWVRVVPHVNDTVLLSAAIALSLMSGQYPFVHLWITAKVLGLLAYVTLGMFALREGRSKQLRAGCGFAAIVVFAYIASVAISKDPRGLFALI